MSPTSKSRKRKRRAQLLVGRSVPAGGQPRGFWTGPGSAAQRFDDWLLFSWTARVAGLLLAAAGAIMAALATVAVQAVDDLHAYQNAPTCEASAVNTAACRQEVSVVVTGTGVGGNPKNKVYYIDVSGLPQTPARIEMRDDSGVWAVARYGDEATVELWHGTPVSVTDSYWTSETRGSPQRTMVGLVSFAFIVLVAMAALAMYWLRLRAMSRGDGGGWTRWLVPLEPAAMVAAIGFFFGAILGLFLESVLGTVALGGGITLVAAAGFGTGWWRERTR
jgi:hypothetical protein